MTIELGTFTPMQVVSFLFVALNFVAVVLVIIDRYDIAPYGGGDAGLIICIISILVNFISIEILIAEGLLCGVYYPVTIAANVIYIVDWFRFNGYRNNDWICDVILVVCSVAIAVDSYIAGGFPAILAIVNNF